MHLNAITGIACLVGAISTAAAESEIIRLRNNPFSRPQIVLTPPPPPPSEKEIVAKDIELQLSATLVSEVAPMVVVDGELLAIGDQIDGFQLIAVREGAAVFSRSGRKFTFEIERIQPQ